MYVVEFAGEDDAFAAREATTAMAGVTCVAPGLAVADAVDPPRGDEPRVHPPREPGGGAV